MMASITPVTYYNSIAWHATILPNGTRMVQPLCRDSSGTLVARTVICYYRRPGETAHVRAGVPERLRVSGT